MNWGLLIAQLAPTIISLLSNTSSVLKTDTPLPDISEKTEVFSISISPQELLNLTRTLQKALNIALILNPPLVEDGWLGPKTEAAIEAGIARLHNLGIG